ncbi:MAG: hypothetical protein OEW68_12655 [Gammaproteobacteria bacterium]|nr:hypothetical protein [Gammaproteobacteria bacterium]MDH4315684.1 hypothetical protein [Gammaproteobacteria bacterium]MDH5215770.1 hypothetical protein [Gammaproteobacteria bacterium]
MPDQTHSAVPRSFWIIAGLSLVWNLLGVGAYIDHVMTSEEAIQALPDAERMLYENAPAWVTAAFAIAVNGGALGCLLLLLRKAWATPVLILSLVGVIVQMYHSFFIANSVEVYGPGSAVMPAMVIVIGVLLVWYSRFATSKGWIS